jgi:hypothetical protein
MSVENRSAGRFGGQFLGMQVADRPALHVAFAAGTKR